MAKTDKTSSSSALPKGYSNLMEDCDRPACDDTVSALSSAMARVQEKKSKPLKQCPPTSPELGKASWTLLHNMAAWYPDKPTEEEQQLMTNFMGAFARFYPCTWCANDFQDNLEKRPVKVSSRIDLCQWLCEQHNIVNEKLGKPAYPCDMKTLDERWRKSTDPRCQSRH